MTLFFSHLVLFYITPLGLRKLQADMIILFDYSKIYDVHCNYNIQLSCKAIVHPDLLLLNFELKPSTMSS